MRTQIATRELNRSVKSYKVYAVKNGWKKFVQQFFSNQEIIEEDPPTVPKAQQNLLLEISNKLSEMNIYPVGSVESREMKDWSKVLLELSREMRVHDWEIEQEKDLDVNRIMDAIRSNDRIAVERESFNYIPKGMSEVEEDVEPGSPEADGDS